MADSRDNKGKPVSSWPIQQSGTPARKDSAAAPEPQDAPEPQKPPERQRGAGRIVHDERGNAIWNWAKETGRFCIDSTSAMLKKLDFGGLKIEGQNDEELRTEEPNRDSGGGYDPYNQKLPPKKPKPPGKK
jgi:hypothetical protein